MDEPVKVTVRPAVQHGWLRRPKLDTASTDAWELPDGQLKAEPKGHRPEVTTLERPEHRCISGGAVGADTVWARSALRAGHRAIHMSFEGHVANALGEIHRLSVHDLVRADPHVERANTTLKRNFRTAQPFVKNLLRRNWFQVRKADVCYAVAPIGPDGLVAGGTAWAVQMFIDRFHGGPCPAFVFDQTKNQWVKWGGRWYPITYPPTPRGTYAGIGSRDLTLGGMRAIQALY